MLLVSVVDVIAIGYLVIQPTLLDTYVPTYVYTHVCNCLYVMACIKHLKENG